MSKVPRRTLFFALKVGVTAALLAYLAGKLDLHALAGRLVSADPVWFAAACLSLAGPIVLTSLRWQVILRAQHIILPLRSVVSFDLVALFFNSFLPGATGGDAVRVVYAIRRFPQEKTRLLASIVVDRATGLLVLLTFGYFSFVSHPELLAQVEAVRTLAIYLPPFLGVCFVGLAVFLFLPSGRVPGPIRRVVEEAMQRPIVGRAVLFLKQQRRQPWVMVVAVLISIVSYLFNFLSAYYVALAIGVQVSYWQIIFIIAVLYTVISVPISFGGHGLREVVLIALFAGLGLSQGSTELAVAYSLLLFSVQLTWSLIGGLWFIVQPKQ